MANGQMANAQMMGGQRGTGPGMHGQAGGHMMGGSGQMAMADGHMMSGQQMQNCMSSAPAAKPGPGKHSRKHQ